MTALLLTGVYRAYSVLLLPLVATQGEQTPPPLEGATEFQPPIFKEVAAEHFAEFPWTSQASIKWQRGETAFLFAETVEPEQTQDGKVLKFAPLAILWEDPKHPEAAPYRIIAQVGRLQFENSFFDEAFDLTQVDPGRIIGAALDGPVTIYGPDGLQIKGRDFVFSEANSELTSYHAVQFSHGPTGSETIRIQGSADGVNIRFLPTDDPVLGKDLPRIAGVAAINLRQNVRFDFEFADHGQPVSAIVTSKGPFEYEFESRKATFEQEVRVTQTKLSAAGEKIADRLVCHALGLLFELDPSRLPSEPQAPVDDDAVVLPDLSQLRLRKVHAVGLAASRTAPATKVILESQGQQVLANLNDLRYDPVDRVAELRDEKHVIVQRGASRFGSPYIRIVHSVDNKLETLTCEGAGQLAHADDRITAGTIEAMWEQGMTVLPDASGLLQVVQMRGGTRFNIPGSLALAADETTLWLELEQLEKLQGNHEPDSQGDFLKQQLPLQQAEARGHVLVVGPDLIVGGQKQNREGGAKHLLVVLTPGEVAADSATNVLQTGRSEEKQRDPLYVEADELKVTVAHDVSSGRLGVQQVEGEGNIRLEQHSTETIQVGGLETERQLTVTAVSFVAYNTGENRQVVTLIGNSAPNGDVTQPAKVELGPFTIEGGLLTLDRQGNLATVEGPGRITFPVPVGLAGEKLEHPADMMVVWREDMTFDGQQATFHGAVQASTQNDAENISRVECEEIVVQLQHRVNFQSAPETGQTAELQSITCRHNVRIDAFAYEGTKLVGRRHAELVSFNIDRVTGDFIGQGPGSIDLWTFGKSVHIAQQQAPVANRPNRSEEPAWRYTNVIFRGELKGNLERGRAELSEDVEIVSAPVDKHSQTFRRHDLSRTTPQAADAAWIGCDHLHMNYPLNPRTKRHTVELLAMGATELEAQQFHATADEIKFEEVQGRFTLRGNRRDALLHSQKVAGEPWDTTSNRLVEFTPSIPRISVDGSTGINGGL